MKPIYLESDEEITSVIDKIKASGDGSLALVVAKNSPIAQSLVNLKLIAKEAEANSKQVCLITSNRVSLKLAGQVGLKAYASLGSVGSVPVSPKTEPKKEETSPEINNVEAEEEKLPDGTRVNQYRPDKIGREEEKEVAAEEAPQAEPESKAFEPTTVVVSETHEEPIESEKQEESKHAEPAANPEEEPAEKPEEKNHDAPRNLPPVVGRTISISPTIRREFHFPWKSAIVALAIIVVGSLLAMIFIPRATVTATFPGTFVEGAVTLNSKIATDSLETTIGGNLLTVSKSATKTITATGKKDIGSKATGTITLYNKASSSTVTLSAGAALTSGGKTFTLDKSASIPGASVSGGNVVPGQASAAITASVAGTDSNLANAQFAITGQSSLIYGAGTTSGGSTKQVTVLSQADVDAALSELRTQTQTEAKAEMDTQSNGKLVLTEAIWESSKKEEVDKAVDAQVDSAIATVSYELSAIAFDEELANQKLTTELSKDLDSSKEFKINPDVSPALTFKSYSEDHQVLTVEVSGSGFVVAKIDTGKIAGELKNLSTEKAKQKVIEGYGAESVDVSISPNWWFGRLPLLKNQIEVKFGYRVNSSVE